MAVLKPFVRANPDAVFVRSYGYRTFDAIYEGDGFYRGGMDAVTDLFDEGEGSHRELLLKPNLVTGKTRELAEDPCYHGGIVTNARFVAGMLDGLLDRGEENITVVEGGTSHGAAIWSETGYIDIMMERVPAPPHPRHPEWGPREVQREMRGARLQWANKRRLRDYRDDELTWVPVPGGVVHREIPFASPFRKPGTLLLNVPTMKTHNLGIVTLCCKALQGCIAMGHKHFCADLSAFDNGRHSAPEVMEHFQPDFRDRILEQHERHCAMGLPLWRSRPDPVHGTGRFECWAQRISDALATFQPFEEHFLLNVVEGIIGRDGTAFQQGKDVPVGLVVAGVNPVHVDAVAGFLMGHDPRIMPHLVVANERGLGENDPARIPTYRLPDLAPLSAEELREEIVPLPVFLHGKAEPPLQLTRDYIARLKAEGVDEMVGAPL